MSIPMSSYNPARIFDGASWLYPFKGIVYFAAHRHLHSLLSSRLFPIMLLSLFIYALLFIFAYLPQVVFLSIFHGRAGAWLNATFLVLGEGAAIVALLFEAFFVDEQLVDVFDAVLVDEGLQDLVAQSRILHPEEEEDGGTRHRDSVKMLGRPAEKAVYSPFSLRQIVEFVFFLPLNFIPWVGVPLFLILTGYRAGPFHHWRYFQLLGFSKKERAEYIKKRQIKYTLFGTVALLLQLVPGLSMVFLLTTAAGSALWASRMEKARRARESFNRDRRVEGEYHDDPV